MIVSKDGLGDFISIQEAIDAISLDNKSPIQINIKNGIYTEKIHIEKPFITLVGECAEHTIITYDDYAQKLFTDGTSFGTFNSYTAFIGTHDFTAQNITFQNTAGPGDKVGQAIAVYADGDRLHFKNCRFIGAQDTLFTGPLPPMPLMPGSFRGPRENAEKLNGRHYYENCFIQGDIDFIFGSATAYFYKCDIFSNDIGQDINGYITAASTPIDQKYGYVFNTCHLMSNCPKETVYLGRPWRHYAHVTFIHCTMDDHIIRSGWHDWDKLDSHTSVNFSEAHTSSSSDFSHQRVSWAKQLSHEELLYYSREAVLLGIDNWKPWV